VLSVLQMILFVQRHVCSALRVGGNRLFLSGIDKLAANWLVACWLVQAWQHYWYALCSVSGSVPGTALLQREREREGLSFSWCVILLIRVETIFLVPGETFRFLRARR
jgi:hypothetical protein